ncbi:MAG: Swt1 family HEPN domain-containing protein [Thermoleophilia bacterium]
MADSNSERVGSALGVLAQGLAPFIDRECSSALGLDWPNAVQGVGQASRTDVQFLLKAMAALWREAFERTLGRMERNYVSELIDARNRWAHQEAFSSDDTYRALDSAERLLQAVNAGEQAAEVARMKHDLQRRRYAEEARRVVRRQAAQPLDGMPSGNLRPWREVVTPHPDVASGSYQQAEFAADLHQVWRGEAEAEYGNPEEFFRRTFLTDGLRELLLNATRRLRGEGGDPVVQLQTNFGGGKTHSLIALYHLAAGVEPTKLAEIEQMLTDAKVGAPPPAKAVVLVGHMLGPGTPKQKTDGTVVNTLWGELAWQLGGADGYKIVAGADEARTNPGAALIELLDRYAPCLILIDEWVAYARQLYGRDDLAGGSFDTQMTFAQALSDAAKGVKNAMLIVSIPASDIEVGGEAGKAALDRLSNVIFRQEASWKPASPEEGFEIVRRRLFDEVPAELARERDAVVGAFADLYRRHAADFPQGVAEDAYRRRIQAAYPIHPELFDKLFNDWSTLEKFQRTRGVLRLMAAVIHALWESDDRSLMILPASVPVGDGPVMAELTRYLEDGWTPVIAADVDGENALPLAIDRESPTFGRYSATRRVARTVYLGSAPTLHQTNKGIDGRAVMLGCVQPGEAPPTFGDALRRLAQRATYLVEDRGQYWYALGQTISRTATDRAQSRYHEEHADEEIRKRLRAITERGDFAAVRWAPASPADVTDDDAAQLVVLGPEFPHESGSPDPPAREAAMRFLEQRAAGPRQNRNMLVFLAPDKARLVELRDAARFYLAWQSIWDEQAELNLDELSRRQAETQRDHFAETVKQRIGETFVWLLTPSQRPGARDVKWEQARVQGAESPAVRASRKLRSDETLITGYAGSMLRKALDKTPLWTGDHVGTQQVWSYFAQYLYLPRLRDRSVLIGAIETGVASLSWEHDTFAYADAFDEAAGRYRGLAAGHQVQALINGSSVVVKPDVARRQFDAELPPPPLPPPPGPGPGPEPPPPLPPPPPSGPTRFFGSVKVDPLRAGRDAGQIAEEILAHLTGLVGAEVEVRIEIEATRSEPFSDDVVRAVTENARVLRFDQHGFENE